MKIAIVNYNIGNLASVKNALENIPAKNIQVSIEKDAHKLMSYDKIILPGVGAFGDAIANLENSGMKNALADFIKSGKYILGICLGMQVLFEKSFEFGEHSGLGVFSGQVVKFNTELKIPHMGWNRCTLRSNTHPLLKNIKNDVYLYFVHSYHAKCQHSDDVLATCNYGYDFPAIVVKENVLGIQPHPEKSHQEGLKILENFLKL